MFVIVGLGNPTLRYEGTRHNVGFDVIDRLAARYGIAVETRKSRALIGRGMAKGHKVMLVKPQTYMNLSGESLRGLMDFYKFDPETELLVICDDIHLDVGQLRIRRKGSAGGHNGLKNLILHLDTDDFARLRIGVGEKPAEYDLANYVLSRFSREDRETLEQTYQSAQDAVALILDGRIDEAMNRYNRKGEAKGAKACRP